MISIKNTNKSEMAKKINAIIINIVLILQSLIMPNYAIGETTNTVADEEATIRTEQIVVRRGETVPLIKDTSIDTSMFDYSTLKAEIATVDTEGNLLGVEIGTTWAKAKNKDKGTENVVIVRVVEENAVVAQTITREVQGISLEKLSVTVGGGRFYRITA